MPNRKLTTVATDKTIGIIRILLVDDHTVVRDGLTYILNAEADFEVVGVAGNGQEALEKVKELQPDLVLMDLQMPVMSGVETIKRLKSENDQIKIIILTTFDTDEYIFEGIRAGARGYLLKDVPKEELCRAVRLVSQGQSLVQPSITARLFELVAQGGLRANDALLTERELEVLKLIARGDRNREIAAKLFIGESTVKGYVTSILQKLDVTDRTEAAMYAVQKGLVKLD
jgi:DNA-binding NarL/FixJ family response regulator